MWNKEVFYYKNVCLRPTGAEMLRGELNTLCATTSSTLRNSLHRSRSESSISRSWYGNTLWVARNSAIQFLDANVAFAVKAIKFRNRDAYSALLAISFQTPSKNSVRPLIGGFRFGNGQNIGCSTLRRASRHTDWISDPNLSRF
jgi:hypothetical protein